MQRGVEDINVYQARSALLLPPRELTNPRLIVPRSAL
jgi:hypothetical protein